MKKTFHKLLIGAALMTVFTIPVLADSNPGTVDSGLPVPEPVTLTLIAAGIGSVALLRKFRKTQ